MTYRPRSSQLWRLSIPFAVAALSVSLLASTAAAGLFCPNSCSSHGTCEFQNPFDRSRTDWLWERRCFCDPGWTGRDCSRCADSKVCGPTHICRFGECRCPMGWEGDACERCYSSVGCGHGKCFEMKCVCEPGWTGVDCTTPLPADPLATPAAPPPTPTP